MPPDRSVSSPRAPADLDRFAQLARDAFSIAPERMAALVDQAGPDNFRLLYADGAVAAGLAVLSMGQFFGGRAVPMAGIALVATAPALRGTGIASRLLQAMLAEQRAAGVPISTLYPATLPVYRRAGYELAGVNHWLALPSVRIGLRERDLPLRPALPADAEEIAALYRAQARQTPGFLDRTPLLWHRVRNYRGEPAQGYVVTRDDHIEGYAYVLNAVDPTTGWPDLRITDCAVRTPAAARRLLTFFADHRMQREQILLRGTPADPLLLHLPDKKLKIQYAESWMLRIVDVPGALQARGYPPGLRAELHFDVRDAVLPQNHGRFVLRIGDSSNDGVHSTTSTVAAAPRAAGEPFACAAAEPVAGGAVEPGGRGTFQIDIRGLAALYTGYLSPHALVLAGLLDAPPAELAVAGAVFAGPQPWMRDAF